MISINNVELNKYIEFLEINDLNKIFELLKDLELLEDKLELNEITTLIEFKYLKAEYHLILGAHEIAFHNFEEVKSLCISPRHVQFYLLAQIGKAKIKIEYAEYDQALIFLDEGDYFYRQIGKELTLGLTELASIIYQLKGEIYSHLGDFDSAMQCFESSISLGNFIDNQILLSNTLLSLGHIHRKQGDLTNASNYYLQALKYYRMANHKQKEALALNHIGAVHQIRGEFQLARENLEESVRLYRKYENNRNIADPLENLGIITAIEGNLIKGYDMLVNALDNRRRYGNSEEISKSLFYLIRVAIGLKMNSEIDDFLQEFEYHVRGNEANPFIIAYWKLSKALVLKHQGRLRDLVEAQNLFQSILSGGIVNHELMVIAIINICEILIYELSFNEDEETFQEAKMHVNTIIKLAQQQNSILLLIEGFIIKSKFSFIEGDTDLANHLLIQAKINAEERGLGNYVEKIIEEQIALDRQIGRWIEMTQQNSSIGEKIQESRLLDYIRELHKL